jgi:hypothetical protein
MLPHAIGAFDYDVIHIDYTQHRPALATVLSGGDDDVVAFPDLSHALILRAAK